MLLIIKAKYMIVVFSHRTPLLEPLSVLLPPLQIHNEFTCLNIFLIFQKGFKNESLIINTKYY